MKWWGQILTVTKNACIHANENIYTYTSWVIYTHRGVQSNMKTLWLQWIPWDRGILCKWAMVAAYRWCFSSGRRALVIATACFSSGILCKRALTPSDSAYRCCFSSGMRTSGNAVYSYIQIHVHALISGESIHSRIRIKNITLIHAYQLQCTRASFPWLGLVRCVCVTVCVCVCVCVCACVRVEHIRMWKLVLHWTRLGVVCQLRATKRPSAAHQVLFLLLMSQRKNP